MSGITVTHTDDRLVAVKKATGEGAQRCRAEARLLARLDHPGLVQFVDLVDDDPVELHTAYAGSDTWDRSLPDTDVLIIEGLATIASTVADLHDLGTAHRALIPGHVVVAADNRPVLCGLGDALPLDAITEADDLAGLAGLLRTAARNSGPALESRLLAIADRALNGDLTARTLTASIDALHSETLSKPSVHAGHRPLIAAGIAIAVLLAALVAVPLLSSTGQPRQAIPSPTSIVGSLSNREQPPGPTVATIPPPTSAPAVPGIELVNNGRRYGIGEAGDVVALGDWNCDGVATPALLQIRSSSVSIFAAWPDAGSATDPISSAVVVGATGLETVAGEPCDHLRVLQADGSTLYPVETR